MSLPLHSQMAVLQLSSYLPVHSSFSCAHENECCGRNFSNLRRTIYGIFQQRRYSSSDFGHCSWCRLGIWGAINMLEGYGNDNPGTNAARFSPSRGLGRGPRILRDAPRLTGPRRAITGRPLLRYARTRSEGSGAMVRGGGGHGWTACRVGFLGSSWPLDTIWTRSKAPFPRKSSARNTKDALCTLHPTCKAPP